MSYVTVPAEPLYFRLSQNDLSSRHPPLVLVHGAGGTHMHWPAGLRRLPDRNVYSLDLPGHGKSRGPGHDTIAAYRDVLFACCQAWGADQVVLVGHSMGGAIVQDFALHYPGRLAGLVLVGTGAKLRVAPAILDGLRSDFAAASRLITDWAHGSNPPDQLKRMYLHRMLENDPAVVYGDYVACDQFDVRPDLVQITTPALVLCGSADRMTPPHYSEYLAEQMANARLMVVPEAGHMVMLEAADQVVSAIEAFLLA